jgi:cytochrome c oxidase assembly factor CtaG
MAATTDTEGEAGMLRWLARIRAWLAPAAVILVLAVLLPPGGSYARQYAFIQALQFVIFAVAAPALLVLGAPWASPGNAGRPRPGSRLTAALAGRPVRAGRSADRVAVARLLAFIALAVTWRLPVVLNALAAIPGLAAAEMVTLVAAGCGVWLELARPNPARRPADPLRAAIAALAMWTIWVIAYVTGMSQVTQAPAHAQAAARTLSVAADRQLAAGIMWAVPAIFFLPAIYAILVSWIGKREALGQSPGPARSPRSSLPGLGVPPRPPRGWRSPPD